MLSLLVFVVLVLAAALTLAEILMGATILGNVIALVLIAGLSGLGFLLSVPNVITSRNRVSVGLMIASAAFGIYVVLRFALESVPAGYGP